MPYCLIQYYDNKPNQYNVSSNHAIDGGGSGSDKSERNGVGDYHYETVE